MSLRRYLIGIATPQPFAKLQEGSLQHDVGFHVHVERRIPTVPYTNSLIAIGDYTSATDTSFVNWDPNPLPTPPACVPSSGVGSPV